MPAESTEQKRSNVHSSASPAGAVDKASELSMLPRLLVRAGQNIALVSAAFTVLATAILSSPDWDLADFDQRFYTTIAYNIDRHGVFANGTFDKVDNVEVAPPPGMFFGPVYPLLVLAGMKIDGRFAQAVSCSVESISLHRDRTDCEAYARPMRIMHALLLAVGVLMIALAANVMLPGAASFWLAGGLATAGLVMEGEI